MVTAVELEAKLNQRLDRSSLADLWALHYLLEYAVFSPGYESDSRWADVIVPSETGIEQIESCRTQLSKFSQADVNLAILGLFFSSDLLIDTERCSIRGIVESLRTDFVRGLISWPYIFGRYLYDRFNDTAASDRIDHLESDEVQKLLDASQPGVYHIGRFLTGPFGIIEVENVRYLPPTLQLPLWHCSDTGCGAPHSVQLLPPAIGPVGAYAVIQNAIDEKPQLKAPWRLPLNRLFRTKGLSGRPYYDIPAVIGDAIIGEERNVLVSAILRSSASSRAKVLLKTGKGDGVLRRSPEAVASSLTEAEQLQLLLTCDDETLARVIDTLVSERRIDIPMFERRTATTRPPKLSNRDRASELSALGPRLRPRQPLVALHGLVWESYQRLGVLEELGWKLRRKPGIPPRGALMDFIRITDPARVLAELVLASMPITNIVAERLDVPIESLERLALFTDRILWKLGFDPIRFPDQYSRLRARLEEFTATVLSLGDIRSEDDRERVRSAGVNLFVSVEELLQELVAYNVWLLASDHFQLQFTFDMTSAMEAVQTVLGTTVTNGPQVVSWSKEGNNALGSLLAYSQAMVEWMKGLTARERTGLDRPREDLPHYADDPERSFVFRHTGLWADSDPAELDNYMKGIESIVGQLQRADIAGIRNGLDHKRAERDFPRGDEMLACATRVRDALEMADALRYLPKVYWLQSLQKDRLGRQRFVFVDYRGRETTVGGPPVISGLSEPTFSEPVLVAPGNLLGEPNAELRFELREHSVYIRILG